MNNKTQIRETKDKVFFNIDSLNLGNNFTYSHMIDAIKENDSALECIDELMFVNLDKDLIITSKLKYNYTLNDMFDLYEFLDNF